ncbi:hypothetical protein [Companilactobacillus ginsenosidimutans]|uniref:Uncharacterized protein n=1 Tax=Companilactobacillus ginsenosidimutans TaxID=1007676 RepID=A0A0H4QIL2_9LACO|nr:hypothetical protein [Companilactobacillus ginsenosidimutans]AKP66871.1 hypothetical protein ABM34_04415 [Companilactobacillus ginsenosidimutans]
MDNVRILKGYSEQERKELEEAKDNGFNSAFDVIYGIIKSEGDLAFIVKKYDEGSSSDNDQLAKDIVDYYAGVAKFPEPKKYYVQLIAGDEESYLNINPIGGAQLDSRRELNGWKVKFTSD